MAPLRRRQQIDGRVSHVVNFYGKPVDRQKRASRAAFGDAGLDTSVVPHTLRHTAITWLMQAGVPIEEVSGFAGVSVKELQRTYRHHPPAFQEAIGAAKKSKRAHSRAHQSP